MANNIKNPWSDKDSDKQEKPTEGKEKFKSKSMLKLAAFFCLLAWLSTGFYTIEPDQEGVVLFLGKYHDTTHPGLNWKLPDPIQTVEKISVTRLSKEFIGVRQERYVASPSSNNNSDYSNSIPEESQMLTGDENIIDLHFYLQWRIKNSKDYIFNVRDTYNERTIRLAAESAMREVLGVTKLYDALSEKRQSVETKARQILQEILDKYEIGIEVVSLGILYSYVPPEVRDAYRDIQSAKADKERFINQAISYRNDILPKARGKAQAILEAATSYKAARIDNALGFSERYNAMLKQYRASPKLVRMQLYHETIAESYAKTPKFLTNSGDKGGLFLSLLNNNDALAKKAMAENDK